MQGPVNVDYFVVLTCRSSPVVEPNVIYERRLLKILLQLAVERDVMAGFALQGFFGRLKNCAFYIIMHSVDYVFTHRRVLFPIWCATLSTAVVSFFLPC